MPLFDLPLEQLRDYRPELDEPDDFDDFWKRTLDEAAAIGPVAAEFTPFDDGLSAVDAYDVRFSGWGGHPIHAWLIVPKGAPGPLPCVVTYLGYSNGRGFPHQHLVWTSAGHANLVMDTRGQGAANINTSGATPDPHGGTNPENDGFMTRGILDPEQYYYRRVYTDAVRAVDAAASHPSVDAERITVQGGSQGGGIAQVVAALHPGVRGAMIDVPFLTHFRRAVGLTDRYPYREIATFLSSRRGSDDAVFRTLSYFDGVSFAARAHIPALYSVGLMDLTCPPSTVFAAYNAWAGEKAIEVYKWNDHEGGAGHHRSAQLKWLRDHS